MSEVLVLAEELITKNGKILGIATLNAEKSLNALNLEMVKQLYQVIEQWKRNPQVACVILQGSGQKAFCAGGDVKTLYYNIQTGNRLKEAHGQFIEATGQFFEHEYRLDYALHTYPKPILCWGGGIVMGGGLGLMIGCNQRVVTETSRIAMPEISIGLYPDVGGTWFLNRIHPGVGLFLGMTGAPLNARDALWANFGNHFIHNRFQEHIYQALLECPWQEGTARNHQILEEQLSMFEDLSQEGIPESKLNQHLDWLQKATSGSNLPLIIKKLTGTIGNQDRIENDPWLKKAITTLKAGSPTSAHLIYQQLKRGRHLSLREAFLFEFNLSMQTTRSPDFEEGVRSLLVDKDKSPQWKYSSFDEVPQVWIDQHFETPWEGEKHPLADLEKHPLTN